jgi:hypothetical protein
LLDGSGAGVFGGWLLTAGRLFSGRPKFGRSFEDDGEDDVEDDGEDGGR